MWSLSGGIFEGGLTWKTWVTGSPPLEGPLLSLITPSVSQCSAFQRPAVTEPRHQGMNRLKSPAQSPTRSEQVLPLGILTSRLMANLAVTAAWGFEPLHWAK